MVHDCSSQCSGQSYFRQGFLGMSAGLAQKGKQKNQQPSGNGCSNEEFPPEMLILPVGLSLIVAIYIYIYMHAGA